MPTPDAEIPVSLAHKTAGAEIIPPGDPRLPANPSTPTQFVDIVNIAGRSDGLCILSFYTKLPGQNVEVARVALTTQVFTNLHANMGKILTMLEGYPSNKPK